jgi:hypothetical protein
VSDVSRALHNSRGNGHSIEWNLAEARQILETVRGPVGTYLGRVVGPAVVEAAKQRAPVSKDGTSKHGPGKLRSSIGKWVDVKHGTVFVDIRAKAFYASMVAEGVKAHDITPKRKRGNYPLRDKQGHIFGRHVHHPGNKPNHFMQDALRILR